MIKNRTGNGSRWFSYKLRFLCLPLFAYRDRDRRYTAVTLTHSQKPCCCRKSYCFIELRVGVHAGTVPLTEPQRTAVVRGISLGSKKRTLCNCVMCLWTNKQTRGQAFVPYPWPNSCVVCCAGVRPRASFCSLSVYILLTSSCGIWQWRSQEFFFGGGFNKFSWGQRTERTGICGW